MKLGLLAIALSLCLAAGASAATLEPVGSFTKPIFVTSDPDDPDRLFVVQREGRIVVAGSETGELADLGSLVTCCAGERGLLSMALAPDFADSGRFYVAYAGTTAAGGAEGDIHVDAFRPGGSGEDPLVREPILSIGHSAMSNHNGGQLQLGPDGYLYLSVGDGGGPGDPLGSGQRLDTLLGKILRIDPRPGEDPAYAIPPGNPFAAGPGLGEIWAYGLRNPWRVSFDRLSGDFVIADVGQEEREEVNLAPSPAPGSVGGAGANYGWNCREGFLAYPGAPGSCGAPALYDDPVFDYTHDDPDSDAERCSITGGYVVREPGDLYGRYVYADFCIGEVRSLLLPETATGTATDDRSEGISVPSPVSFGEDSAGRVYLATNGGDLYRLVPEPVPPGPDPSDPDPSEPDPPGSDPFTPSTSTDAQPVVGAPGNTPHAKGVPVRLHLRAVRRPNRVEIRVRAIPCQGQAGAGVQLNRGGRRVASKRLDAQCRARFRVGGEGVTTFRALLQPGDGSAPVRSRQIVIAPG